MYWFILEHAQIRQRVRQVLAELKSTDAALVERLRKKAWRKFGEDHPV